MCAKKARFLVLLFHAIWEWEDCKQRRFCVDQERVETETKVFWVCQAQRAKRKFHTEREPWKTDLKGKTDFFEV